MLKPCRVPYFIYSWALQPELFKQILVCACVCVRKKESKSVCVRKKERKSVCVGRNIEFFERKINGSIMLINYPVIERE